MNENNDYIVQCDDCKKMIKRNATLLESVQGGRCNVCKNKTYKNYMHPPVTKKIEKLMRRTLWHINYLIQLFYMKKKINLL